MNELSQEIFNTTYRYKNESVDDMFKRVANGLATLESFDKYSELFYDTLKDFKFIPGGRIISNVGTEYSGTSLINCFVSGFTGHDLDSAESISRELTKQFKILKSEGGYGFCCSILRPRGSFIEGIGSSSPGMVQFLDIWDTQSYVITMGSGTVSNKGKKKIRKGAMMVTAHCWHPDIIEFIKIKNTPNKLTKFNMSVLLTDKFMEAVDKDLKWDLVFPDIEANKELYKTSWNGDLEEWEKSGGTLKIYKTIDAKELYNLIMDSTYNRAEPGCLFVDTINKRNNLKAIEHINATNPCGEQPLPIGGACLLGSINLTQFINIQNKNWDYPKLNKHVPNIVRMLDNVIDLTYMPLEHQYTEIYNKRRIGLGFTGLGSALFMLNIGYGSEESKKLFSEYMDYITNLIYQSSAYIAKEKGAYPRWNYGDFTKTEIYKLLNNDTRNLIKTYGLRNSHLTSIQPTGNTSILANNVSGGIEPVFMAEYIRTHGVDVLPEGLPEHTEWADTINEGDTIFKTYTLNGVKYKWLESQGYTKESLVEDYSVTYLKTLNKWDPEADWAKTTTSLSVKAHLDILEIAAPYIDAAISKTVNIPHDYPFEDFKDLYMDAWKTGTLKGITTYRAGTMSAVLKSKGESSSDSKVRTRPNELECSIIRFKNDSEQWIAFIGLLDNKPYEIFTGINDLNDFPVPKYIEKGIIIKNSSDEGSRYDFEYTDNYGYVNRLGGLNRVFHKEYWNYARFVSALLREGLDLDNIIRIIEKLSFDNTSLNNWQNGVIRSLKTFIKDGTKSKQKCKVCQKSNLIYQEGCLVCPDCGHSGCS